MLSALSLNYPGQGAGVPASQNTGTYYAPDGQILSKKALVDGLLNKDGLSYNDPRLSPPDFGDKYTGLKMWLEVDALDDFRFLKGWILDARTGRQLNLSGFYHDHDFIVPWSAPIPMLHPGPVRIVVDIAFGPGRDYTLPAQIGAHVDLKHTSLHLLDIRKGRWRGSSMSSDSKSMTGEYEADVGYNEICLIVAMETTASLPFDIFYEKSDGSLVDLSFGSTNNFLQLNCPDLLGPDDNLMIREYEQVKRLVFTLPRLPGLPEENLGVDNLAAVKIPYVKLDSRRDLSRVAAAYLQVKYVNDREHGLKGGKEFPMVLKDTTPAEMLRLYMSYESKPGVLVVDPLRDEVRIEDNLAQKVSAWVRKKLNF
ncbi:MAG: hypothetical protein QNK37_34595 [Acidobacteriota bacterium]|nr:hypothetical protein [Acidobacteriota bacterium]